MTQTPRTEQPGELLRGALAPLLKRERRRQLFTTWAILAGVAAVLALGLRLLEENRGWPVGKLWWVLLAATAAAAWIVWLRLRRQSPDLKRAAHLVERAYPELSALLLTAVAQSPPQAGGRLGYMQEELVREAVSRSNPRWNQVISSRRLNLTAAAAAGAGVLVVYCAVTALMPDLPSLFDDEFGARISPGHIEVERGTNVLVLARFDKKLPPGATLTLRRPGKPPLRTEMRRTLDDPVFGALTPALDGERAEYSVEYGSVRSPRFKITVFELPEVDRIDARIEYPRQPSLSPKDVTDTRHLTVVLGARVTVSVHLNTRAGEVALIGDGAPVRLASRSGANGRVFWGVLTPDKTRRYEVLVRDERGRSNKAPPRLVVEINPNQAPQISLSFPGKDQRVSPLAELALEAKIKDDVGVMAYGLSYRLAGQPEKELRLGGVSDSKKAEPSVSARASIALEDLKAAPYQLLTYHFWAEDLDATGKRRRAGSDLYFAEVRPFEERFREAPPGGEGEAAGEQQDSPAGALARTQKEVMNANWRVERDARGGRAQDELRPDIETVSTAQKGVKDKAEAMRKEMRDPTGIAALGDAVGAMDEALVRLRAAAGPDPVGSLVAALEAEQRAFAALLRLSERERMVSRGRGGGGGGGGQNGELPELSSLELKQKDSRYETRREASNARQRAGGGDRETLSKLQELARRQKTLTERIREAQAALSAVAQEEQEEQRRRLKKLRDEQQQLLSELDDVARRQNQNHQAQAEGAQNQSEGELARSRQEAAAASQALAEGQLGQAVGASTRATRELESAKKELEKQIASGFEQEMRELRETARRVDEEQRRIGESLGESLTKNTGGELPNPTEVRKLASAAGKQKGETQRLLEKVQSLSTEAEPSAPLLSRKLYEGLRKAKLADVENALDVTGQLLERNLAEEARETEQHARQALGELRASVEEAAKGVLGDEAQALRQAKAELDGLLAQAARERTEGPPGAGAPGENQPAGQNPSQASQSGPNQPGQQPGGQPDPNRPDDRGQPGNRPDPNQPGSGGQQPGGQPDPNQPGGGGQQPGNSNQPGGRGQQPGNSNQPGGGGQQPGNRPDPNQPGGQGQGLAQSSDPLDGEPGGGGGGSGPGGGFEGPITGEGYRGFSERLRDVEDLLTDSRMRNRTAQVRERARALRADFKGSGKRPTGKLFEQQILSPLTELRDSVAEELARLDHDDKLVPIDRDPVPNQYSDLVRRYWKRLSEGR